MEKTSKPSALNNFIKKRRHLIWYVEDFDCLSEEAIVEGVLNYGDFDDVKELISILGIKRVSTIFRKQLRHKRINYDPKTINYFRLYFNRYA
ncbi:hypothetical protein A3H65_02340 [Candidatus Giovannonibacteria bacterium RIFCSPLOWO2_02_FULL_45_14]|uniref:Uncharacterized protein n=1 Tax=Candidatus Giovannonibacteria bacterium RIFCSPLOWO2_12_FULL_44_15 TaxID=1798364 RepID=A0A1F5XZ09_9BACT|nr:MAG: hypothetical protein A3C75_02335 [Candidatus Giovannonibacteria bacterium RIFCSPHIGHO2_02_FULL_44_31]OGF76044.1 MAG: hypothetical protein A3E62_02265 [Candidatus Giovannonibacteria bacterium RIFCSPHIGHO2_12_FULL_44_29]OGF91292.1 MAG: hypothetical protein A3H65_02340 [Candidatus Giovannonibacteria bacterium RIFCSPLOWO2_02_FULL_45_14]OGF93102.1 MAG: hypothetical protein A3G54_02460 [Candidatus Giovannonibacteria bacterium RIFCSPLOWO2_12_FULL_44_15]